MKIFLSEEVRKFLHLTRTECLLLTCILCDMTQKETASVTGLSTFAVNKASFSVRKKFKLNHTNGSIVFLVKKAIGIDSNDDFIEFINSAFQKQLEQKRKESE